MIWGIYSKKTERTMKPRINITYKSGQVSVIYFESLDSTGNTLTLAGHAHAMIARKKELAAKDKNALPYYLAYNLFVDLSEVAEIIYLDS